MPTLREFVVNVLTENNIQSDPDEIIKQITDIAKNRAVNNVAAISDDEVKEMVINNAELAARLAQEKKNKQEEAARKKAEEERIKAEQKEAEKREKALEKERKTADGEQLGLFDL